MPGSTAPQKMLMPFLDLKAQFATIRQEILDAVMRTLETQQFILGPEVTAFENEISALTGCACSVACASGSDALILALLALEIGPGDEVITTPFTFFASAGSIARVGAKPVFVDIDPRTFNISPQAIQQAITPKVKAIMPIHLFGLSADMNPILELASAQRIPVIEDAAQAIGARYAGRPVGSLGLMGCFSFFPSKNLGAAGDAGIITTSDAALADRLRLLHVHGARDKYVYELLGMNSRLDALQAAILRVKLKYLDKWAAARQRNADRYRQLFREFHLESKLTLPGAPPQFTHVYNQFTIRSTDRDNLREHLRTSGIPSEIYYPIPLHLQKAFSYLGHKPGDFPASEVASREVLSLPIYPELSEAQQRSVVTAIAAFYSA
ncbi:MAG TPA: DegT/DnrJ/EryC1/StrS family aminotransferase [Candidatus Acidoferrum sp.]